MTAKREAFYRRPLPSEKVKAIFVLHGKGWTPKDIAGHLGISRNSVCLRLRRARAKRAADEAAIADAVKTGSR